MLRSVGAQIVFQALKGRLFLAGNRNFLCLSTELFQGQAMEGFDLTPAQFVSTLTNTEK